MILSYPTLQAFVDSLPAQADPNKSSGDDYDPDFYGPRTYAQVKADALQGSPSLAPMLASDPPAVKKTAKRRTRYDVAGHSVNVPRFLANDPLCMRQTYRSPKVQRVVTIAHCVFGHHSNSAEALANRGRALLEIIDSLEYSGTRVELIAHKTFNEQDSIQVRIKAAEAHYDRDVMALVLVDPGFLRRLIFRKTETDFPVEAASGYGNYEPIAGMNPAPDWETPKIKFSNRCLDMAFTRDWLRASAREAGLIE